MTQKAGCAGSNRKEMLCHPVKVNVLDVLRNVKLGYIIVSMQ